MIIQFEWDIHNFQKISASNGRTEITAWGAEQIFNDPNAIIDIPHNSKSKLEVRFMAIGLVPINYEVYKYISLIYTYRNEKIRPISVNFVHSQSKEHGEAYKCYWQKISEKREAFAEYYKWLRT